MIMVVGDLVVVGSLVVVYSLCSDTCGLGGRL